MRKLFKKQFLPILLLAALLGNLPDGTKVWDSGNPIGANGETGVRVHIDGKGNIHGYPVNPGQYLPNY